LTDDIGQEVAEKRAKTYWASGVLPEGGRLPDLLTKQRVRQMQQAFLYSAKLAAVDVMDVQKLWSQYDTSAVLFDGVHPGDRGCAVALNAMLEYLRLA
jgi:hypothetical protein